MTTNSSSASLFASWRVGHVGVRVPDFAAAVAWYTETLAFRVTDTWQRGERTLALLSLAGDDRFQIELLAGAGAAKRPEYEDLPTSLGLEGWHHVCFYVDNLDETLAELRRRDVQIVGEPRDIPELGRRVAFFADPWGNLLEMMQA